MERDSNRFTRLSITLKHRLYSKISVCHSCKSDWSKNLLVYLLLERFKRSQAELVKLVVITCMVIGLYLGLSVPTSQAKNILEIKPLSAESYSESFTLGVRLEHNSYLLVQAMLMNGGLGDEKPACRILYVHPKQQAINEVNRDGEWHYTASKDKLRVGSCLLQRTATGLSWKAKTQSLTVELSLEGKLGQFSNETMSVKLDKEQFKTQIIMPNAQVLASIKQSSKSAKIIKGQGVLNHARSTILPPKLAKRWFKLYAFAKDPASGQNPFLLLDIRFPPKHLPTKQQQPQAWAWLGTDRSPQQLTKLDQSLEALSKRILKVGDHFSLDKYGFYTVKDIKPKFKYEPIKAYGLMGKMLKSWVGDPINRSSLIELETKQGLLFGMIEEIEFR